MARASHLFFPTRYLWKAALENPSSLHAQNSRVASFHAFFFEQRRSATVAVPREFAKLSAFTRDEQIDTTLVQVKTEDGGISEPEPLRRILQTINREDYCIVQLSKPGERDTAIVQVKSKLDLLKQLREKENQLRQAEAANREKRPKQLEVNWAIGENDLNIKLKQLTTFLDKGKVVEILLAAKRKQRKASEEEGTNVLTKIRHALRDAGAKEIKPMDGQVLKQATLVVKK